jgi:hypothetical protein
MFSFEEMVETLRKGIWEADCVEMTVTQNNHDAPVRFVGPGYLRQAKDGSITYKVYPSEATGILPLMPVVQPMGVIGTLIEPNKYYRLDACAHDGARWQVARTLPSIGGRWSEATFRPLVDGTAREIFFSRPARQRTVAVPMASSRSVGER